MTAPIVRDWEDVLYAYLEGRGLRADAEDLRLRLHLSAEDRDEIERTLHLVDQVTAAVRMPTPPIEFEGTLVRAMRACPAPARLPQGWVTDEAAGGFAAPGVPAASEAGEDLLDGDLDTLQALRAAEPAAPAPDAAMRDRLRGTLRAFMESEAGEIDAKIAERLLGAPRAAGAVRGDVPDVIAASSENDPDGLRGDASGAGEEPTDSR